MPPTYLLPYLRATQTHGDSFRSLLWASRSTQRARFDAICRLVPLQGRTLLDAGCGRADLLDYLKKKEVTLTDYVGIEAIPELATAAERREQPGVRILRGDFIAEPVRLFVGAEVVVFCGSLNTVSDTDFYPTLRRAWDATAWTVVLNFLSSSELAGGAHLYWRPRAAVEAFIGTLNPVDVQVDGSYISGDCTIAFSKVDPHA